MRAARKLLPAALLCCVAHTSHALEANEIFKLADPSIVVITTLSSSGDELKQGSGVLIEPRELVTSCHVVKDAARISVKQGNVVRAARLRFLDDARDLCQLQLDDVFPTGRPATDMVMSANLEVGQRAYVIAAPRGLERTISRGIVSGLRDIKESARLVQTDAAVSPGSSGGGLFDSEARLIGIITFGLVQENLNFAIPADWIQQLKGRNRDRLGDADPVRTISSGANSSPARIGSPRIGDRWKYRLLDGKRPAGTVVVEIIDVRGNIVSERVTREDLTGFSVERNVTVGIQTTRIPEIVATPGGYQLIELAPYVPVGQTISTEERWNGLPVTVRLGGYGYGKQKFETEARVVGREKISVPAGKFDAVRVQLKGQTSIASDFVRIVCDYWYSEDSMRTVKMNIEIKYTNKSFQYNPETYELVAYEPAQ